MRFGLGNPALQRFETIVYQLPDFNFESLTRSCLPLMSYWRLGSRRLRTVLKEIGEAYDKDGILYFEYPVPSARPRFKPSFTDAMYATEEYAIAFEAKWTEPLDNTVTQWLAKTASGSEVIAHWESLIAKRVATMGSNRHLPYQFIHRVASAAAMTARKAHVVFQIFSLDEPSLVDATRFDRALRDLAIHIPANSSLALWKQEIAIRPTTEYEKLRNTSAPIGELPMKIRRSLIDGELFDITHETVKSLHEHGTR